MMTAELPKSYTPRSAEGEILSKWDACKAFHATPDAPGEPYSIVIPPPNVTAALHLGHAFNNTLQDVLIRYHRMRGFNTLWMPGTDHAGIATQTVVEKRLLMQGKKRTDFTRDEFVAKVQAWKDEYEATIIEQLKMMGCSCDFDRTRFTMDDMCAKAVREAFFRLFKDGLIYRGKRLVNWDPVSMTALADDEVEMKEVQGHMWYLKYPLEDGSGFVTVATTRPETMLGDTAVAMNPKDPRAEGLRGKKVRLPIVDRVIPIIEDPFVVLSKEMGGDPADAKSEFATGFLKVTPAHDPNDYEIGLRHKDVLGDDWLINILAPDATISDQHGWDDVSDEAKQFIGQSREDARKAVVKWFKSNDLLESIRDYSHSVGHSYRSHVPIEPYLSDQWYVKVSDDSWQGEARRAMSDEQYEGKKPERSNGSATDSGTGILPVQKGVSQKLNIHCRNLPHWQIGGSTYFITYRCESGDLDDSEKQIALDAIRHWHGERWHLHLATIMPDHVHLIVTPLPIDQDNWHSLPKLLHSVKSFSANTINEHRKTTGSLWQDEYFYRIIRDDDEFYEKWNYMVQNPVKAGLVGSDEEYAFTFRPGDEDSHGQDARATNLGRNGDGELSIYPARYAKTFQSWHENIRDWCISRQLWWGHRIPVWSKVYPINEEMEAIAITLAETFHYDDKIELSGSAGPDEKTMRFDVCLGEDCESTITMLEELGFERDPDVLDTWFSSGLWPMSTMGWPDPSAFPETEGLLDTFNPSSVLCTGRDIITLWVSRMVMFNRYFRDGTLPFKDVYINPMIQDGHGQRMSKSLGNGVDPRDIIHSHGADALRYVMCELATSTQDVRLPVDMVCPHCDHEFDPKPTTSPQGYRVAAPEQVCSKCNKTMVSAYGVATGLAMPTDESPLARNASQKFDKGRNFANKLWNATRFALGNITSGDIEPPPRDEWSEKLALADRWIITRLHRTLHTVEDAIKNYQFSAYADAMYDFIWRDFCDWYLEAIKPTIKENPIQQHVLRTILNATLRLLHPICPFVTETLWPHVQASGRAGLEGIELPPHDVLSLASWPDIACSVDDVEAAETFEKARSLTEAIRSIRGEKNIPGRKMIGLEVTDSILKVIDAADGMVQALAGLESVKVSDSKQKDAIPMTFDGEHLFLTGLVNAINPEEERIRLQKIIEEKQKAVAGFNQRLQNENYVKKAPPHLVEETRQQLAEAEIELVRATKALQDLVE
ncbi:MAG: class I tRNA ligase family protein [Planctomycetota bacterium]|nr:class I tRNA ligase family protein [Planctomycetota bacterium]